jgi:hypothetical protein
VWNLLHLTQQDDDENVDTTHDEDELLNNKFDFHELNYRTNWQDAQGKESILLANDLI